MLQNRSLLLKVEVLSLRGDKTSICCVKLLQSILNFYHHKITKKCRGGRYPPSLKTSACKFSSAKGYLNPPSAEKVRGGGQSGRKWGRQLWPILVHGQTFSSNIWKHITLNCTKYECQCNTIHSIHFLQFGWSESSGFEIDLAFVRNVF